MFNQLTFFRTRWEMSTAGAAEAWPLVVLVWTEEGVRKYSQKESINAIFGMPVANKTQITFDESPFCTADPVKAEDEEPPS